jgi:hypothetical protein
LLVRNSILPLLLGDSYMDVAGRATQEAKAESRGEGFILNTLILTFSQRENELKKKIWRKYYE